MASLSVTLSTLTAKKSMKLNDKMYYIFSQKNPKIINTQNPLTWDRHFNCFLCYDNNDNYYHIYNNIIIIIIITSRHFCSANPQLSTFPMGGNRRTRRKLTTFVEFDKLFPCSIRWSTQGSNPWLGGLSELLLTWQQVLKPFHCEHTIKH